MKIDIVHPSQCHKGMTYGDWAGVWANWLLTKDVDSYFGQEMLFLRGNVDFKPVSNAPHSLKYQHPNSFLDKTGQKGHRILRGTSILIPIATAYYVIGDYSGGKRIRNQIDLRNALSGDFDHIRTMWATIKIGNSKRPAKIVQDISSYKIESPVFKLTVPSDSVLNIFQDDPLKAGTYDAIIGGYFILIRSLIPSLYRISFGSEGPGEYTTRSIYDIEVHENTSIVVKDISERS